MQEQDEIGTSNMTDEQRELLDERLLEADGAAQKLVDAYADDPDLKFVENPSLIGDGINVIDNTDSSAMPRTKLSPKQLRHIKRMMAGPGMREKQPRKAFENKVNRTKKRKMQKLSRKGNRQA